MPLNPEDMDEAEETAFWLEIDSDGYTIYEGETKEDSEEVHSDGDWFAGAIQEIDRSAGDYDDSRLYKLRHEAVDGAVLLWGKADIDRKVDNAALASGDEIAIRFAGTQDVGREQDMFVYDVRYDKPGE